MDSRSSTDLTALTIDAGSLPLSLRQRRDNVLYYFFIVQVISVTVLQKIGISLGDDAVAPLAIPLMLLGLAAVIFFVPPIIDSKRCLLYTSPSPRDLSTSRMPSSA